MSQSRRIRRDPTPVRTMERNRTFAKSYEPLRSPNQIPKKTGDASNRWTKNQLAARAIQLPSAKRLLVGVDAVLRGALIERTDSATAEIQGLESLIAKPTDHLPQNQTGRLGRESSLVVARKSEVRNAVERREETCAHA